MTQLYCATEPSLKDESGLYYDNCKLKAPNPLANNEAAVEELYSKSLEFVKEYLV
jgi:hypothetical protein